MDSFRIYSDVPKVIAPKVVAEIDADALKSNYKTLCALSRGARPICVVKADAYGHATAICVPALLEEGCDFFAVSCIEEAIAVRMICLELGKRADILILGYTDCRLANLLIEYDIIQTVISEEYAKELVSAASKTCGRVRVHVALDTGMNRVGLCAQSHDECIEAVNVIKKLASFGGVSVEGLFTHFSRADEDDALPSGADFTRQQFERMDLVRSALLKDGIKLFCHASNSAAAIRFPEYALDGVRFGIALYGVLPSGFVKANVTPVMSLCTVISHIHTVSKGASVGYGGAYRADSDVKVATLPIGYADGFLRAFGGFEVTVHTKNGEVKAPVIGRICMDQCMIDIGETGAEIGDAVTVFGKDPRDLLRLAEMADTIEYEVLCLVSGRVPRVVKGGRNA